MKGHSLTKKALAVCVAAAFSSMGLALTAQAAEPSYGNINPAEKGSITIYKHENTPDGTTGAVGDTEDTISTASKPIQDVLFRSFRIKTADKSAYLALTGEGADANWKKISEVSTAQLEAACADTDNPTIPGLGFDTGVDFSKTDAQGMTKKSDLAVGAYLVCEVETPARVLNKATPFIVTIPHPGATSKTDKTKKWHYNVTVYPKNTVGGITKTIKLQEQYGQGSDILWPVTVDLPKLPANEHLAQLIVQDDLSDARYKSREVASVKLLPSGGGAAEALTLDRDYKVTTKTHNTSNNILEVGLTKAGLTKAEGKQGGKLEVVFKTPLNSDSVADGILPNKATLFMKTHRNPIPEQPPTATPPGDNPPGVTTPPVESHWGNPKIKKVDADNAETPLKGAKFQIYSANAATAYADDCTTAVKDGSPLSINGHTTFESNEKGEVNFGAVFVSDNKNATVKDKQHRCYVVVETQAPDGFVTPTGDNAQTKIKVKIGQLNTGEYNATVKNSKSPVPGLPLTGANGRILMVLLGGAIIAIAGGSYVVYRRKTRQN